MKSQNSKVSAKPPKVTKPKKSIHLDELMSVAEAKIELASPNRGPNDLRFKRRLEFSVEEVTKQTWNIQGLGEGTTNQVWEWICILTADGMNLKEICGVAGAPSIRTVFHWRKKFPVFAERLKEAEDIRAYLLAEEATSTGRDATQETAQAAKVAFTALTWRASKLDPGKFADKKIEEHTFDFSDAATAELKARVQAMAAAHPHLIGLVQQTLDKKEAVKTIDITPIPVQEGSPP